MNTEQAPGGGEEHGTHLGCSLQDRPGPDTSWEDGWYVSMILALPSHAKGGKARDGVQLTLSVLKRVRPTAGFCAPTLLTGRFLGSHHRPKHSASDLLDTRVILVCASEVF